MGFEADFDRVIPSPNHGGPTGTIVALCFHDTEGGASAAAVGQFFANPATAASTTGVFGDADSCGCVPYGVTAWHTGAGSPWNGAIEGYEHVGYAAWTGDEWMRHGAMLEKSAKHFAMRCRDLNIPPRKITPSQLATAVNQRDPKLGGICSHHDITIAAHVGGGHTDPGPNFPWDYYIARVQFHYDPFPPAPTPAPDDGEDDMLNRPCYIAPNGETWWEAEPGRLAYIDDDGVVKMLRAKGLLEKAATALDWATLANLIKTTNGVAAYNEFITSRKLTGPPNNFPLA